MKLQHLCSNRAIVSRCAPVAPCACHYNTASEPLSPLQSHAILLIYHAGEYSSLTAWPSSPRQSQMSVSRAG